VSRRTPLASGWESEALPIHLRCFSRPFPTRTEEANDARPRSTKAWSPPQPSDMTLVFDTETTIDPSQRVRVLFYQLRVRGQLDEEAAAYDPAVLSAPERATLHEYCAARGLPEPMTMDAFRRDVFFERGYDCGAEIVGFNLPFDLSRIAIGASPARVTSYRRKMRGGFSLKMSDDARRPHVQVKQLGARSALFEFTAEYRQRTSRPDRKRDDYTPVHRGHFTDVRTLAAALTSRSHSLKSLTNALGVKTQKTESDEHGGPLSFEYLDYARSDVQATWECFEVLTAKYRSYGLGRGHWEVLSEASIGKATLSAMGVRSWLAQNPQPAPELMSKILGSYFGGRTEVRWRKTVRQVFHTDFTSMYPTVCTLQGLWRFIVAKDFKVRDTTGEIRELLAGITAAELADPQFWPRLTTLVCIAPEGDLLPVRACYAQEKNATIGLNYLTSKEPVWLTLADCIAAKILSGKAPQILEALTFEPGSIQSGLQPIKLFGHHKIDPRTDDLFRRLIQLRIHEKARVRALSGSEKAACEDLCQSLKITANSSSYGIFVQVNVDTEPDPVAVEVFRPDGRSFVTKSRKVEQPGPFFHPLLATLITGAARLMLALAEHRATSEGLDWVFCDTDSLALMRPDGMSERDFEAAAYRVVEWFAPLNPYGVGGSILKPESANFGGVDGATFVPLYCVAISSKRYVLFNISEAGAPVIRKGSAHGLGHLRPPYGEDEPAPGVLIDDTILDDELPQWQHDLWVKIVEKALHGRIHETSYDYHRKLKRPALSRYGANSPELWRWFWSWNEGRDYGAAVKPFGFLYALHGKRRGDLHPIAPFDTTPEVSVRKAFDRVTGAAVPASALQTYAEALQGYHLSPESKFRNGEAFDQGRTERRHIQATAVEFIGKEADRFEEAFLLGTGGDLAIRYGAGSALEGDLLAEIAGAANAFGDAAVARATALPRSAVARIRCGDPVTPKTPLTKIRSGLAAISAAIEVRLSDDAAEIERIRAIVRSEGSIRKAALMLGVDHSNLSKRLKDALGPTGKTLTVSAEGSSAAV
jgi:hypothetical protein